MSSGTSRLPNGTSAAVGFLAPSKLDFHGRYLFFAFSLHRKGAPVGIVCKRNAELIPGYRLTSRLGKGAFGEVWKCDAPGGLPKALKRVRSFAGAHGESDIIQLERDALDRIKAVRHPFLLTLDRVEIVDGELIVVMELADGLVQRETAMLLAEPEIKRAASGLILSAGDSLSALWGTERLRQLGYRVIGVSGKFTSSPLAIREYVENDSAIPVLSSVGKAEELCVRIRSFLQDE